MGTKTASAPARIHTQTHHCEKRIPKHGDENLASLTLITMTVPGCEKRIPKHGDEGKTCVTLIVG